MCGRELSPKNWNVAVLFSHSIGFCFVILLRKMPNSMLRWVHCVRCDAAVKYARSDGMEINKFVVAIVDVVATQQYYVISWLPADVRPKTECNDKTCRHETSTMATSERVEGEKVRRNINKIKKKSTETTVRRRWNHREISHCGPYRRLQYRDTDSGLDMPAIKIRFSLSLSFARRHLAV